MANKPERIVLDTNVFIYFLISNAFHKLDKRLKNQQVKLLLSEELLAEFMEVVNRPKFRKYFSNKEVNALLEDMQDYAEFITVNSYVEACRDRKDNFLLALCIDGKADYLITGDEDLLVMKKIKRTSIVNIAGYLRE